MMKKNAIQKVQNPSEVLVRATNIPSLSKTSRQIAGVMVGDRIKDLDIDSLHLFVSGIQREVLIIMGQGRRITEKEGKILEHELRNLLCDHFGIYTVGEVKTAMIWGARGRWDLDDIAYSIRTVNLWLERFAEDRKKAVEEMRKKPLEIEGKAPDLYPEAKARFINSLFRDWCEGIPHIVGFNLAYQYARDLKILKFSNAERWEVLFEARDQMIQELRAEISPVGKIHRRETVKSLKAYKQGDPISSELKSYAIKILVLRWFHELKLQNKEPVEASSSILSDDLPPGDTRGPETGGRLGD